MSSPLETVTISTNISAFHTALEYLGLDIPKRAAEMRERFVNFSDRLADLFVVERKIRPAAGASRLIMAAKPSKGLEVLMPAMRASNLDLALLDLAFSHGVGSSKIDCNANPGGGECAA
jgi:hypothetical protein